MREPSALYETFAILLLWRVQSGTYKAIDEGTTHFNVSDMPRHMDIATSYQHTIDRSLHLAGARLLIEELVRAC